MSRTLVLSGATLTLMLLAVAALSAYEPPDPAGGPLARPITGRAVVQLVRPTPGSPGGSRRDLGRMDAGILDDADSSIDPKILVFKDPAIDPRIFAGGSRAAATTLPPAEPAPR